VALYFLALDGVVTRGRWIGYSNFIRPDLKLIILTGKNSKIWLAEMHF
jgi:hypothetical protein